MKACGSLVRHRSNSLGKISVQPTSQWLEHLQKRASVSTPAAAAHLFHDRPVLPIITSGRMRCKSLERAAQLFERWLLRENRGREIKCADLELNVLISTEDVTARVNGTVKPGMNADQASAARAMRLRIEKESKEKTRLRSDVITLYQGGAYYLYRYKRYDDVRIVFAPEQQMAFTAGTRTISIPAFRSRYMHLRVYENGQPAKIDNFLKWNSRGPGDGELTFVSGSPGKIDNSA
jgi:hypothetical protein